MLWEIPGAVVGAIANDELWSALGLHDTGLYFFLQDMRLYLCCCSENCILSIE